MMKTWVSQWLRAVGIYKCGVGGDAGGSNGYAGECEDEDGELARRGKVVPGELSNMVGENIGLDPKFMEQANKKFAEDFQEEYFEDKNADGNNESTIRNTLNIYLMMTPMRTILKVFLSPWSWLLM